MFCTEIQVKKVNQEKVFGRILVLRMFSNMITMLMDEIAWRL